MKHIVKLNEAETFIPPMHSRTLDRKLIDEKIGATRLALWYGEVEPGGKAEPHSHEFEQAYFILEGKALCEIRGKAYTVEANTTVFLPAETEHAITVLGNTTLKLLIFMSPLQ